MEARLTETTTFDDYATDARFEAKKPFRMGSRKQSCGDNIYFRDTLGGDWCQRDSFHSREDGQIHPQHVARDIYTEDVGHDREHSLRLMRERMFSDFNFKAAVFIGGMGGIVQEFDLLQQLQPKAVLLPVTSTGGAVLDVAERMGGVPPDLRDDLDYIALFHRHLDVSVREMRYRSPTEQPRAVADRLWQRPKRG